MRKLLSFWQFKKLFLGFSSIGLMAAGVALAALVSQPASLTGNSIASATADLRIGTSATSFAGTRAGFSFTGVVPGGPAVPVDGYSIYLKNYGTAIMAIKLAVGSVPLNTSGADLSKVYLSLTRVDSTYNQKFSIKALIDANSAAGLDIGDSIGGGVIAQYKLGVSMDADAFAGSSVSITGIDFVFSGLSN